MSELIRREDAIKAVEMFFKDSYIEDSDVHCTDMEYEINHIPAASPWHRVEDELPPKGFALIGARKRPPEISEDFWDMWVCEYDEKWGWQDMDGFALRGITHWMPIEPPKEESK